MTIGELARKAGVSNGLLSQLERGIGNPSIQTLSHLARALGFPIGTFFEPASAITDDVVHPHTRRHLLLADQRMIYQLLVPDTQGAISMLYIELPPGFSNADAPFKHNGEEVVFVLSGSIEIHLGDRVRLLEAGELDPILLNDRPLVQNLRRTRCGHHGASPPIILTTSLSVLFSLRLGARPVSPAPPAHRSGVSAEQRGLRLLQSAGS